MLGEVQGVKTGQWFESRAALHNAEVHRGYMRGIAPQGASIVLSGGYIDDEDNGDEIIYTGEGGREQKTGRQISDQTLKGGNLALVKNCKNGVPVRVTRGFKCDSDFAPSSGYRYDGLYRIDKYWKDIGVDGFNIWRFKLSRIEQKQPEKPEGVEKPKRQTVYTSRVVRDSKVGNYVKELYGYRCQISGVLLETPIGAYAEACHIQPVGKPHNGPDIEGNILCLTPNMHVLFDLGAISVADDFSLLGMEGRLIVDDLHGLNSDYFRYHREHIYLGA